MGIECDNCGKALRVAMTGRPKRFCGQTCRKAWSRRPKFPAVMTDRHSWARAGGDDGKHPLQADGHYASSTDPATWASFVEVQHGPGVGFGIMLGDGLGCYDLDDVTDDEIRSFVSTVREPIIFIERSLSGGGAHVFVEAPESVGWKRVVDGVSVERYTRARFIRTTGREFLL